MQQAVTVVERVKIEGFEYQVDERHNLAVGSREVEPGGYVNPDAVLVAPHTETGKRRLGWRIEWLLLILVVLTCNVAVLAAVVFSQ